jgi:hypothetical protein
MSKARSVTAGRDRLLRWRARRAVVFAMCAALAGLGLAATQPAAAAHVAAPAQSAATSTTTAEELRAPLPLPSASSLKMFAAAKLGNPTQATSTRSVRAAAGPGVDPIDLRVLVLATKGDPNADGVHVVPNGSWDWNLSTLTQALDYTGAPYDVYKSVSKQLCVGGTWKLDWSANPNATDTSCSSGNVTSWAAGVTPERLWDGTAHAYYQGIMQTNGTLSYLDSSNVFQSSALTTTEWSNLWTMEAQFGIRTVSANTFPTADFGLTYRSEDGNATTARWTSAGAAAFPYVNASGSLAITNSYTYRAGVTAGDTTTSVLLNDTAGDALAVVHTYANQGNRQTLALTFDSAGYLLHGQVLGYGLVNWVTKGLFLGERHAYLAPQPDDLLINDSVWQPTTPCGTRPDDPSLPEYRMTGNDLNALANWQTAKRSGAISKNFRVEWPFNGVGQTPAWLADNGISQDTLTPRVRNLRGQFAFINHTWDHQNLDGRTLSVNVVTTNGATTISGAGIGQFINSWGHTVIGPGIPAGATIVDVSNDGSTATLSSPATQDGIGVSLWVGVTYDQVVSQITQNNALASTLGLGNFSTLNLIQPDISGLTNQNTLQAAYDRGIRYLISDTSRTGDPHTYGVNEGHRNTGTYNPTAPGAATASPHGTSWNLLELARYPVNLYSNVTTPAQWLAEDNCLYPVGAFGHVSTYQQLIDRESSVLVKYLLQGANRPLMFHQTNATAYSGTKSLLSDLMDATLSKYSNVAKSAVLSPTMNQLGQKMSDRMAYNQALATGLSASIVPGVSLTLTNNSTVTAKAPVTGLNAGAAYGAEQYAGQNISYIPVAAGQSVTLPLR